MSAASASNDDLLPPADLTPLVDLSMPPDLAPPVETNCANGIDDDGDGKIDCADSDCNAKACGTGCTCAGGAKKETRCNDGVDNDGDGKVDCADSDCLGQVCAKGVGAAGICSAGALCQ